ncbi:LysR family transcriptional regulator [Spelaeicoccus albus]|uniref:DNA-binding transcriptional LysR family regulator n=1 Tax=Spelaeicoccus albus TaxID=1280376 RepID=A0A7Z0D0E4_9MICO|nr:LysR family transcriptional regulator [Spelaeicoccus albus]NYI67256.1 DNA-binding transcriptional LysR family regulator [Spelaeicoccus albus]
MTPTQLTAYAAVVRLGSVKEAARELEVTEAAVSMHVARLRKELDDQLFTRTYSGLAFTPGGLRLASRATEILGLQNRTVLEVGQAGRGRRLLRMASTALFAEHAAPGLIELFANRAKDLDVELSVRPADQFEPALASREVDVAIGPRPPTSGLDCRTFLNFKIHVVAGPEHPLANIPVVPGQLADQPWLLGPSAVGSAGGFGAMLDRLNIAESRQRIFQSDAAAIEETKRANGISLGVGFVVADDLAAGRLVKITGPGMEEIGSWTAMALGQQSDPAAPAAELLRFITTPRATQAMLRGSGVNIGRFRPSVYVTLWS